MPAVCKKCGDRGILKRPKTGDALCKECFYAVFESEIHETILRNKLFKTGELVAIGASGGKEHFLHWIPMFELHHTYEDPKNEQTTSFLQKLARNFLIVTTIKEANVDFSTLNFKEVVFQHPDNLLFIGFVTKTCLHKLTEEGDINPAQQNTLYKSVRAFYVRTLEYRIQNLPLNDDLLENAKFVNFNRRECANFSEVECFVKRFDALLPFQSPQEMEKLSEEFIEFQLLRDVDIRKQIWGKATVQVDTVRLMQYIDIFNKY